jgi:hypothetical protein
MKQILAILLLFLLSIHNYGQSVDSTKSDQDSLKWIPPVDCEPCCHKCNLVNPKELEVENGTEKIIYLFYQGFNEKDCCLYTFGEIVYNAVFQPKFSTQIIYLLDHQKIEYSLPSTKLSKELKKFCIAIAKYDKNGIKEIWNPYKNPKYKNIEKINKK